MLCFSRAVPSAESKPSISGVVLVDVTGRGRILPRELVFERLIEASRDLEHKDSSAFYLPTFYAKLCTLIAQIKYNCILHLHGQKCYGGWGVLQYI